MLRCIFKLWTGGSVVVWAAIIGVMAVSAERIAPGGGRSWISVLWRAHRRCDSLD